MHLKKNATVLISTAIILSLMSVLGCFFYKMMRNNNEIAVIYKFDTDIYDLRNDEEKILYEFMKEINEDSSINENKEGSNENNSERTDEGEAVVTKDISLEEFKKVKGSSILEYDKNNNQMFLTTVIGDGDTKKREIKWFVKNKKIILVPTYKFKIINN